MKLLFLSLGFRIFYPLAALFAIVAMALWLFSNGGSFPAGAYLNGPFWHGHEMVYGFAVAVMTGFLLTAVRNWTGLPTLSGAALAALALLWLAARVFIITGPGLLAALADVLFIPALLVAVGYPVLASKNRRNYKILLLLLSLAFVHVIYHLAFLGGLPSWLNHTSIIVALELLTILFAIVAGRVIPAFTRNAIPNSNPRNVLWLEVVAFGSLLLTLVTTVASDWMVVPPLLPSTLLVVAAVSHLFRLAYWQPQLAMSNALLWMLPAAYSWLPTALLLRALSNFGVVSKAVWIHALTAGAISSLMMAMMMRSSLGHTGRPLAASRADMAAFLLLTLAALIRVSAGAFDGGSYAHRVGLAGVLWMAAFAIFLLRYLPMLVRPRADGRPG